MSVWVYIRVQPSRGLRQSGNDTTFNTAPGDCGRWQSCHYDSMSIHVYMYSLVEASGSQGTIQHLTQHQVTVAADRVVTMTVWVYIHVQPSRGLRQSGNDTTFNTAPGDCGRWQSCRYDSMSIHVYMYSLVEASGSQEMLKRERCEHLTQHQVTDSGRWQGCHYDSVSRHVCTA